MAKPSPRKPADSPKIEFEPDAWQRFESLVKSAAKIGHKPHDGSRSQPKKVAKKKAAKQ